MSPLMGIVLVLAWIYILHVLKKSELKAWKYIWGSCGLFIIMMIFVRPYITEPLARSVAAIAGAFGNATGMFSAYFKYGVIFVNSGKGAISLVIDFECSGVIEIMAYVCLLTFFETYSRFERLAVGIIGSAYIVLANVIRIISICIIIHCFGASSYYIAHTFVGRIIFYGMSIALYFMVFTKSQIVRQKVGGFAYGINK